MRNCIRCNQPFDPVPSIEEKLQARGRHQRACASCALEAIHNACAEDVANMTDEEIEAELWEDGVDLEAFKGRVQAILRDAMAKRDDSLDTHAGEKK